MKLRVLLPIVFGLLLLGGQARPAQAGWDWTDVQYQVDDEDSDLYSSVTHYVYPDVFGASASSDLTSTGSTGATGSYMFWIEYTRTSPGPDLLVTMDFAINWYADIYVAFGLARASTWADVYPDNVDWGCSNSLYDGQLLSETSGGYFSDSGGGSDDVSILLSSSATLHATLDVFDTAEVAVYGLNTASAQSTASTYWH